MVNFTHAQEDGYTWASKPWLNSQASYHRMTYEDRSKIQTSQSSLCLIQDIRSEFGKSSRSRLVIRFLIETDGNELNEYITELRKLGGNLSYYQDQTPTHSQKSLYYATYSENKKERSLSQDTTSYLTKLNRTYIEKILKKIEANQDFRIKQFEEFQKKWFTITADIDSMELAKLWMPFWWSEHACQDVLSWRNGDFVLGVRSKKWELVAGILYSHQPHTLKDGQVIQHGELTEATTIEHYRWNGIMWVLATALHVKAMMQNVFNIYGEYRALWNDDTQAIQSLKFAIESGVHFTPWDMLINHVDVDDISDPHNQHLSIPWYWPQANQLKSFMLGSLNTQIITPEIQEMYKNSIS